MGFTENDDVIEAFPADLANQSLRMPVCQGKFGAVGVIAYFHGCKRFVTACP
jgi:hypothetical protein